MTGSRLDEIRIIMAKEAGRERKLIDGSIEQKTKNQTARSGSAVLFDNLI